MEEGEEEEAGGVGSLTVINKPQRLSVNGLCNLNGSFLHLRRGAAANAPAIPYARRRAALVLISCNGDKKRCSNTRLSGFRFSIRFRCHDS